MTAKLLFIEGTLAGEVVELDGVDNLTIGRASSNDISLDDRAISRRHCLLEHDGDFYWLLDMDSHNGTLVNGRKVTKCMLFHGDEIRVGHVRMKFSLPEQVLESEEAR